MKRILVIDDDPAIRLLYQEELLDEGCDVLSSDGGEGVLQLIAEQKPHLILLDLKLGNRNGLDLLQEIRKESWPIPVILLTAYPSFKLDSKSLTVYASVTKNSDLTGLKQQIAKCLSPPDYPYIGRIRAGKSPHAEAAKPGASGCLCN
jgi:CheY-like chemotaxis protein